MTAVIKKAKWGVPQGHVGDSAEVMKEFSGDTANYLVDAPFCDTSWEHAYFCRWSDGEICRTSPYNFFGIVPVSEFDNQKLALLKAAIKRRGPINITNFKKLRSSALRNWVPKGFPEGVDTKKLQENLLYWNEPEGKSDQETFDLVVKPGSKDKSALSYSRIPFFAPLDVQPRGSGHHAFEGSTLQLIFQQVFIPIIEKVNGAEITAIVNDEKVEIQSLTL